MQIKNTKIIKSWDDTWENIFQERDWGKYPPEELIRFTARNFYSRPKRNKTRFLDLGCGIGSNSWYLAREGFDVHGVDGSKTGIIKAKKRFLEENLKGDFKVMDYIQLDFPANYFDVVIDIASIQHNQTKNVPIILNEIKRVLKPNGKLLSIIVSAGTYNKPFEGKGYVHFYKLSAIKRLFSDFKLLSIEKSERTENNRRDKIIHWIISCEKKA